MVKVGDTVVSVSDSSLDITVGNEYVVTGVSDGKIEFLDDNNTPRIRGIVRYAVVKAATPPQKIQQNGYEYELVGPVKPEWLVDGAWVVDKETGRKYRVSCKNGAYMFNNGTREVIIDFASLPTRFLPHTASDWKWGDWALYDGKRVFVIGRTESIGMIAVSSLNIDRNGDDEYDKNYAFIRPSELTPTF